MQGKVSPGRVDNATSARSAPTRVYVGIDVCKAWLDVYIHPFGQKFRVANDRTGLKGLKRQLARHGVIRVVMEATGKYHREAHRNLHAGGFAVAVINPLRARLFAEAVGALAKTDAIDARVLAILAESLEPQATVPPSQTLVEIQELFRARQAVVADGVALSNQLGEAKLAFVKAEIERRIKAAERSRDRLQAEIERRIKAEPGLARRFEIVGSIPGAGPVAASALVIGLSELGNCSSKQAAMLAGLAPLACDSGAKTGDRRIRGGRAEVRCAIFMAAVAAARCNPHLKTFYKRLRAGGKTFKVAITAVMRKLVVLANTLLAQDRLWQPTHA